MKLFLRYQLTGTVFVGWFVIFYYASKVDSIEDLVMTISQLKANKALLTVFVAYPIGVIIHQFSVLIKNKVLAIFWPCLSDAPILFKQKTFTLIFLKKLARDKDLTSYYLERTSNLNTFFYVRFDNGFLSPLLAFIAFIYVFKGDAIYKDTILLEIVIIASLISIVTLVYIPVILKELDLYYIELETLGFEKNHKKNSDCCSWITVISLILISALIFTATYCLWFSFSDLFKLIKF